eukprot:CAMPEP_0119415952 /NCGR_PEP_ID=MMETSP1335-20130426/11042_1 /TAXON_ID=259385 /ORGANISM="Chrysoculter rhomboideus, Strain RCC1486" /LENGTH=49 /DNA_ID=CAMNT_0007441015 /DNA_START=89 /DNA_END=238 /DNA_ORIENTATION=+
MNALDLDATRLDLGQWLVADVSESPCEFLGIARVLANDGELASAAVAEI